MTDLPVEEREAMEAARDSFQPIHGGIHPSDRGHVVWKREGFEAGWGAGREYSKQREEKLREVLLFARGELHRALLERGSTDGYSASFGRINAALAENGDSDG